MQQPHGARNRIRALLLAILATFGVLLGGALAEPAPAAAYGTCPTDNTMITSYKYVINGTTTVYDLTGNTHAGDTVKVVFTLASGCSSQQVSLVSYKAPGPTFDANTANQQTVYQQQTGSFSAGVNNYLQVTIPSCYFQIDFVRGAVITTLGPAGSTNFYSAQNRLIDANNGGTGSCVTPTATSTLTKTPTATNTPTKTPVPPTYTPSKTPTSTATKTSTPVPPTYTPAPPTNTPTPVPCPTDNTVLTGYYYLINGNATHVPDLGGVTHAGDTVQVVFTVRSGCSNIQLSLVSYKAPGPTFDANTADQQTVYQSQTGYFSTGTSSLTVMIPSCFYQIDFVRGAVITTLGPAGSTNFY
ncbi:MAG: hypothetical protein QOF51_902, partial [Chloroflexota bacterium]|nr:hypothetical protein [Chloroflexota bacterium]